MTICTVSTQPFCKPSHKEKAAAGVVIGLSLQIKEALSHLWKSSMPSLLAHFGIISKQPVLPDAWHVYPHERPDMRVIRNTKYSLYNSFTNDSSDTNSLLTSSAAKLSASGFSRTAASTTPRSLRSSSLAYSKAMPLNWTASITTLRSLRIDFRMLFKGYPFSTAARTTSRSSRKASSASAMAPPCWDTAARTMSRFCFINGDANSSAAPFCCTASITSSESSCSSGAT
mmetsp:Transcript_9098/g.20234  ORF Transcript_9098/g.20234 Transcript_9098/m.20234 type:complete len:229 (-) Transcript_9098:646-1332(-)